MALEVSMTKQIAVALAVGLVTAGCGLAERLTSTSATTGLGRLDEEVIEELTDTSVVERVDVQVGDDCSLAELSLTHLDAGSVPEAVRERVREEYSGVRLLTYVTTIEPDDMVLYRVNIETSEGRRCAVAVEGGGFLVYSECAVEMSALPVPVTEAVEALGLGEIMSTAHREGPGLSLYIVEKRIDRRVHVIELTVDGEIVAHDVRFPARVRIPYLGGDDGSLETGSGGFGI